MKEYILSNKEGLRVGVLDYGATITFLEVPLGQPGLKRNVVLGCDADQYPQQNAFLGSAIGRVANRIGGAVLQQGGQLLDANEAGNCLHGGDGGFHRQTWTVKSHTSERIHLSLRSEAGDQGFPGTLQVELIYSLENNDLNIAYTAQTDALTPVNLTNHLYFNLDGKGDVLAHSIQIDADDYLPADDQLLPLARMPVKYPFDFRNKRDMAEGGYDHCFCLNTGKSAVRVWSGDGRLYMEMWTDQPGVQFYTGNGLAGSPAGAGREWQNHQGFCLEAQQFPDSVNRPELGDPWLKPGDVYRHNTCYRFTALPGQSV